MVRRGRLRPQDRQAAAPHAQGARTRLAGQGALGPPGLVRIRRARPGDAGVIARLANALNRHEHLGAGAFDAGIVRRDAFGPGRAFRALVAEAGGRGVVGYASFLPGYNTDFAARELFLLDLYVRSGWRGRGIGRALVAAVAREARRRGLDCLTWGVRGSNRRAQRFYRRLGARVSDVRIAVLRGRRLRALAAAR